MPIYVYLAAALVGGSIVVLVAAFASADHADADAHANLARDGAFRNSRELALSASARSRLLDPFFGAIARRARRLLGAETVSKTQRKLELSALTDQGWTVERVLVIRVLLGVLGGVLALTMLVGDTSRQSVLLALLVAAVAYLGPGAWLDRKASERQAEIERRLPDVIDQITVGVESGLGFDAALSNAASGRAGPLADELRRVLQDIQVGATRQDAFERLLERTDVADLRQFVTAIRQSTKHGLPMSRVLRVQSEELRDKRQGRIEERAASLPVKIVFPLVFCILPSLFVVVLGPAALDISKSF